MSRLFVDMDGTLAVFTPVDRLETLYEPEYFETLPPIVSVCKAVKLVAASGQAELYILSSVLPGSPYAIREKDAWLDRFLPQINAQHRLFPPCGQSKALAVPGCLQPGDTLLDDYTDNLLDWPGRGIKLYNGINGTRGRWKGDCLRYDKSPEQIAQALLAIIRGEARVFDARPGSGIQDRVQLMQSPIIEY